MNVGEIRTELKRRGLTQQALADHLGMNKGDLSKLLRGKLRMRLDTFRKIEAFLAAADATPGVAEDNAPFAPLPTIPWITVEEALALRDAPRKRMSDQDRERWLREMNEIMEMGRRMPRLNDMSDDDILGYDGMP
jgi:transcriptional regulator with XRE-family HTH domain